MGITSRASRKDHSQQEATQEASSPLFSVMHSCYLPVCLSPGLLPSLIIMTFPISPVCEIFKISISYYCLKSITSDANHSSMDPRFLQVLTCAFVFIFF